jgi:hypothetical protein
MNLSVGRREAHDRDVAHYARPHVCRHMAAPCRIHPRTAAAVGSENAT